MSGVAKAACVVVNLDTERSMLVGVFTDDGTGMDPRTKCEALWASVEDDWPGYEPAYVLNDEAAELQRQVRMWQVGMSDDDDVMPARIEAHNAELADR